MTQVQDTFNKGIELNLSQREFEAVAQSNEWGRLSIEKRYDGKYSSSHTALAYTFWQASREQLKSKLLSDEMVEIIENKIFCSCTPSDNGWTIVDLDKTVKLIQRAVVGELCQE